MRGRLTIASARSMARRGALLVCTVLTACCSTGPEENPWSDAASFGWHQDDNKVRYIDYIEDKFGTTIDTVVLAIRDSMDTTLAKMKVLEQVEGDIRWPNITTYASGDTLYVNDRLPASYQIVGPIRVGQIWYSDYKDTSRDRLGLLAPTWRAEITERYLQYNDDASNNDYANVVKVVYRSLIDTCHGEFWVRYFAKGVGPIRTEKFYDQFCELPVAPFKIETIVLLPD